MAQKILQSNVIKDYEYCKGIYAMYINRVRIAPSIRDGLKPVTRRVLVASYKDEKAYNGNKVKSAAVVGTVMKKYHPHGDAGTYDNMKMINNDFEINYPLSNGQGNWGNAQGAGAAAYRYTEFTMSAFAVECIIGDLAECNNIVDWKPTYDGKYKEPEALPVKIPYLLINGAYGIGYGMSCSIPPHNLGEVIDAEIKLIKDPSASVVLKPEQAMPCEIVDTNWKAICNKGNGKFIVRSIIDVCEDKSGHYLLIRSLPDRVFMNSIKDNIIKLIDEKKIVHITDLVDASETKQNKNGEDITTFAYRIDLKKGTDPNYMKEYLYKHTKLQTTINVNFMVLDDTNPEKVDPVLLSYKAYLEYVIIQTKLNKFRLYTYKIRELNTVVHKRDAYIKILQSGKIMDIINLIRKQNSIDDNFLIDQIMKMINITPLQATYIINQPNKKLSEGYLRKYVEDNSGLEEKLKYYEARIFDESLLEQDIIDELLYIKQKYAVPRKCKMLKESEVNGIPEGEFRFILTEGNFVKKIPLDSNFGNLKGDMIKTAMKVDNTANVLLFDEQGKVFKLPIHKLPLGDNNTPPIDLRTLLKNCTSNINTVIYEPKLEHISKLKAYHFITVLTNKNIKKMDIADFLTVPPSGIKYIALNDGDKVTNVSIVADGLDILVYSRNKALRMNIAEVPHQKRINAGMKAMDSAELLEGLSVLTPNVNEIVVITDSGKINKFSVLALPPSNRAKGGTKVIKLGKTDSIHSIYGLSDKDKLRVVTRNDKIEFNISELPEGSSVSPGKQMIKLVNGDHIIRCNIIK